MLYTVQHYIDIFYLPSPVFSLYPATTMITVALRLGLGSGPWSKCRENNPVNSVLECSGAAVLGNAEM